MERGITVPLQNVTQLINIGRINILFEHKVFKTELLLNCRENLGTFCSTSVNQVSQSMKAVLPKISSQLIKLNSDVNDQQNTRMGFLCSKFIKINDNVVTMKNDVACTTTVSTIIFQVFLKVWKRFYEPEPLEYESIKPSDQVFNVNSPERSNLDNMTNEVPTNDINDTNKSKKHENVCPPSLNLKEKYV